MSGFARLLRCRKDLGQFAEVLGGGGEEEFVVCAAWTTQSKSSQSKNALEMGEQHLDLLPELHRDVVLARSGDVAGDLAGSLRDELLNEEMFDSLDDARRKLALWRYDYNNVRPHSSLGNQAPVEARRALEHFEGSAPDALAQTNDEEYETPTRKLSL